MDVMLKITRCLMNDHCLVILDEHGTKFQYGERPEVEWQGGLFTLKTPLNLPTYIRFADLVRVFDNADHEFLVKILEKLGALSKLYPVVEIMHEDPNLVLKLGRSIDKTIQETRLRQGDNVATVLFPFLIAVFANSLEVV